MPHRKQVHRESRALTDSGPPKTRGQASEFVPVPKMPAKNLSKRNRIVRDPAAPWHPREDVVPVLIPDAGSTDRFQEILFGKYDENLLYLRTLASELSYDAEKCEFRMKTRNLPTMTRLKTHIDDLLDFVRSKFTTDVLAADSDLNSKDHAALIFDEVSKYNSTCLACWQIPMPSSTSKMDFVMSLKAVEEHATDSDLSSRDHAVSKYNPTCLASCNSSNMDLVTSVKVAEEHATICSASDDVDSTCADDEMPTLSSDEDVCGCITVEQIRNRQCHFCGTGRD